MSLSGMKLHLLNVFFCVALLDKRVASWSSVSNFSNSATLRCACLLPICLLGMLNDLGCRFFRSQNRLYFTLSMQYEILNKTLKEEMEIKVKREKRWKQKGKYVAFSLCQFWLMHIDIQKVYVSLEVIKNFFKLLISILHVFIQLLEHK